MSLPIILGVGAAIASAYGVGSGIKGTKKIKKASYDMKSIEIRHSINLRKFKIDSNSTNKAMDKLGELELQILKEFNDFSNTIEKIQNRPQFKQYDKGGIILPKYDKEELKKISIGAGALIGALSGTAVGTAGGFAAAGATTAAVAALGTASTGTVISSLSGAALTNATLAALGGGAIAAGGGGIALGTTILGATTLGVGLLVGGFIININSSKLTNKVDEAKTQMTEAQETINKACNYLTELESTAINYIDSLNTVREKYLENFNIISNTVNKQNKVNWNNFTEQEKKTTENLVMLVGLLYKMCQVSLVIKAKNEDEMNKINKKAVDDAIKNSEQIIDHIL